jgi:hypothetical protein
MEMARERGSGGARGRGSGGVRGKGGDIMRGRGGVARALYLSLRWVTGDLPSSLSSSSNDESRLEGGE